MINIHLHPGRQRGRNGLRGGRRAGSNGLRHRDNGLCVRIGIHSFIFQIATS